MEVHTYAATLASLMGLSQTVGLLETLSLVYDIDVLDSLIPISLLQV
jgi:hypothetical protein